MLLVCVAVDLMFTTASTENVCGLSAKGEGVALSKNPDQSDTAFEQAVLSNEKLVYVNPSAQLQSAVSPLRVGPEPSKLHVCTGEDAATSAW